MPYNDFTLADVKRKLQLTLDEEVDLFSFAPEVAVSAWLSETLRETLPLALAINTEKIRSELIIAPVLVELRKQAEKQLSFFSGVDFTIDSTRGLNGICDFIVSQSPEQFFISAPVLMIVEAKNENIKAGLAQCIAAMVAAQVFNAREGNDIETISGVVTTGTNWRFLQLTGTNIQIDRREYYIDNVEKIIGILVTIARLPARATA